EGAREKYLLRVRSNPRRSNDYHRAVIHSVDAPNEPKPLGAVVISPSVLKPGGVGLVAADLDESIRGKGLGLAAYEAALAYAKNHLGATHVFGGDHSSMASAVHRKLAQKHDLDYKPVPNEDNDEVSGPYDDKYAGYSYALKTELKKDEAKPQEPVEPEMQPLSFYLGSTASSGDIAKAKGNPDPHLRAMG